MNDWAKFCWPVGHVGERGDAPPLSSKSEGEHDGENADHDRRTDCRVGGGSAGTVDEGATVFKKCGISTRSAPARPTWSARSSTGWTAATPAALPATAIPRPTKISGIVWNEETFEEYIKDPKAKIPGTKMIFAGIKNEQEAKDLWAYIKQFDPQGNIKK